MITTHKNLTKAVLLTEQPLDTKRHKASNTNQQSSAALETPLKPLL